MARKKAEKKERSSSSIAEGGNQNGI